ncbi:MAG: leucine-rich repeat domain-containing protein, partial [Ureaplasma sp.]|nr:leucine-rich repeat domain-containing protein [Ureaplasma sp.]
NITFTNDLLKIQPNTLFKFIPESPNNIVVNENIQIQNLMFYTGKTFVDLQLLYNVINNYIIDSSRKFTVNEFKNNIPQNLDSLKFLIAKNLKTNDSSAIGVDEIGSLSINSDNNFVIELNNVNGTYFKFSIQENNNVFIENNKLIIKNLTYYTDVIIDDEKLKNLWSDVNEFVTLNKVTIGNSGNINSYLNYRIYDFFKSVKTTENKNLSEFILSPQNSLRSISVQLKSGLYKINSKNLDNDKIVVKNNTIYLNNLYLMSPEEIFTWSGNEIIGLTNNGKQEKNIVLPPKTTSLAQNLFNNYTNDNPNLKKIDMSLTTITNFIDADRREISLFSQSNVNEVILPDSLIHMGAWSFFKCKELTFIKIPNKITEIPAVAFSEAGLSEIELPINLQKIGDRSLNFCVSLEEINLPNTLNFIDTMAFRNCIKLKEIYIPHSVTKIGKDAFRMVDSGSTLKVIVPNEQIRQMVLNSGFQGPIEIR